MRLDDKERLERVANSEPINIVAARVMFNSEAPPEEPKRRWFETCPPLRECPDKCGPEWRDLTGVKFGYFTVVGLLHDRLYGKRKNQPAKWVVRCICGNFEIRVKKAIENPANSKDRCHLCRDEWHRRRSQEYREYGYHSDEVKK